jgi:hypothetical protein
MLEVLSSASRMAATSAEALDPAQTGICGTGHLGSLPSRGEALSAHEENWVYVAAHFMTSIDMF